MENIHKTLTFILLFVTAMFTAMAQSADVPGYEIKINAQNISQGSLYLQGYKGQEVFVFDSAKVKGRKSVVFKNNKKTIPTGIYAVVDRQGNEYVNLIVDHNRKFNVNGEEFDDRFVATATVEGSDENTQFVEFQKKLITSDNPVAAAKLFHEAIPASFLGHFIKAKYNLYWQSLLSESDNSDDSTQYQQLIHHYFGSYTFDDGRLLHTPIYLDVENYFLKILPQNAETIGSKAIDFLQRFQDTESFEYYLSLLMNMFDRTMYNMAAGQVFVKLYDTYCDGKSFTTLPNDLIKYYQRTADRKRKLLPGQTVPALKAYDIQNKEHLSSNITKDYIILWFWDPDCDDCVEMTPKLHAFYQEFAHDYNVEVFAVAITEDIERWDNFCQEQQLSWINTCDGMNTPNYDFIDYFDIITTPVIYLLDKNHTIIAHSFPLEDLHNYFIH